MKKIAFLSAALVLIAIAANAQIEGIPSDAPIDGGLSVLLIAGAAGYGAKLIAENRKKKEAQDNK